MGELEVVECQTGSGRAGDGDPAFFPLVEERGAAGRADREGGVLADGDCLGLRLLGDCRGDDASGENLPDLGGGQCVVEDAEIVEFAIEKRIGVPLAVAEQVERGVDVGGLDRERGRGVRGHAVDIERGLGGAENDGEMCPHAGRQGGGIQSGDCRALPDFEACSSASSLGGEIEIFPRAVAEVEDALPVVPTVPQDPARDGEFVMIHEFSRQGDVARAAQGKRLASDSAGVVARCSGEFAMVGVAGIVGEAALEIVARHHRADAKRCGVDLRGVGGAVEGLVHRLDLVVTGGRLVGGAVGVGGGGNGAGDQFERAFRGGGSVDVVAVEIALLIGVPGECDGGGVGHGREAGRCGGSVEFDRGPDGDEPPLLVVSAVARPLVDVRAVVHRGAGDIKEFSAPAAADVEPAVLDVFEEELLVRAVGGSPLVDVAAVVQRPVQDVQSLAAMDGGYREVAKVPSDP